MPRLAVAVLLSLAAFQDDARISRWIEDLEHEEIVRREEAQGNLIKAGAKAAVALKRALLTANKEAAARISNLVDLIERPERERLHDLEERRRRLQLLTFEEPETRLGAVFATIERELQYKVVTSFDADRLVRIQGRDQPVRKVLDALEPQLDVRILELKPPQSATSIRRQLDLLPGVARRSPRLHLAGLTVEFTRQAVEKDGKVEGWSIHAGTKSEGETYFHSIEVLDADRKARPYEVCGGCGRSHVLALGEKDEDVIVRIRGEVIWKSIYLFKVSNPAVPEAFKVGDFTIQYDPARLVITSPRPVENHLFATATYEGTGAGYNLTGTGDGGTRARASRHATWCVRREGAYKVPVDTLITERGCDLSVNAARMTLAEVKVSKPIREPFDQEILIPAK